MEDHLIKAQLCCQEAENAMVTSNFLLVAEKFQEASQIYTQASLIASSTANRLQLESFAQFYARKANEAEAYINQSGNNMAAFDYGSLGNSEDSDSEETSSGGNLTDRDSPMAPRRTTPSLDVIPARQRTGSWPKPASLEEQAYAVQLEKRMSTSPLQALALGFQTVKDLVLGARPTGPLSLGNISPTQTNGTAPSKPTSLGESFFLIADTTSEATVREQKLEEELTRVQGEFQKVQTILDKIMQDQQAKASRLGTPSSSRYGATSIQSTALAREAHLKQSLRENYLAGSDVHLSKTELESEIKKLREQLTSAERRNAEWAVKFDQIKQKAMRRPRSDSSNQSTSASAISSSSIVSPSTSSNRPATTASSFHSPSRAGQQLHASEMASFSLASSSPQTH